MYDVTYENLLERMLARVSDKFDKREGSVIFDTHSPTAIELQILYTELNTILTDAYGDTAAREFLILRCKERGIYPYEATHAILKGKFTPANIDVNPDWRVAQLGGRWHSGASAGAFSWYLDSASSDRARSIGGRLVYVPSKAEAAA